MQVCFLQTPPLPPRFFACGALLQGHTMKTTGLRRNHPQLTPICASTAAATAQSAPALPLPARPRADGRAECFDFLIFGVEIHEEVGVVRTC